MKIFLAACVLLIDRDKEKADTGEKTIERITTVHKCLKNNKATKQKINFLNI